MGTHTSSTRKKKKIGLRHHNSYNLTSYQFIKRLKNLIERASSAKGLDSRSATEILLEDRK